MTARAAASLSLLALAWAALCVAASVIVTDAAARHPFRPRLIGRRQALLRLR